MGIYTLSMSNGPHISPIVGGYVAKELGWRWCLWIPAIVQGSLWVLVIFTLPETLYSSENASSLVRRTYTQKLIFFGKVLDHPIRLRDFGTPFRMIRYAAITLPCIYYMTANTYGSAVFAITGAKIAASTYNFDVAQTGLFIGLPLTIGCMIGEATTGWISDIIINRYAKRHNGYRKPEARLFLIPLCTLLCIGTATFGFCIEQRKRWIMSAVCMTVSALGCQVGATVVYTYCTDSYKPQSGEIGAVINLFKSSMSDPKLNPYFRKVAPIVSSLCFQHRVLCSSSNGRHRIFKRVWLVSYTQRSSPSSSRIFDLQGAVYPRESRYTEGTPGFMI